jgi:hypothetical protein
MRDSSELAMPVVCNFVDLASKCVECCVLGAHATEASGVHPRNRLAMHVSCCYLRSFAHFDLKRKNECRNGNGCQNWS